MAIKFTCPHCQRGISVKEQLAGKKGACPGCKQVVTVPTPAATAAPKIETPPPPPVDVDAEAAALFSDEPAKTVPVDTRTIDLNCPFCDEQIHFPVDLAGKRSPCPECKQIIKVPDLVKKDPKDWRKADPRGPSGARLPDQPALEGAWGSAQAGSVGKQALVEAGVIPTKKMPRTLRQKYQWPVLGVSAVLLLAGGGWLGYRMWSQRGIERGVQEALAYAASEQGGKEAKASGQAAIALAAGEYAFNGQKPRKGDTPGSAVEANKLFLKALNTLRTATADNERDLLLTDLAVAQVELGGDKPAADAELRLPWKNCSQQLAATLREIHNFDGRRQAVRVVAQKLIERGQSAMVLPLLRQIYTAKDGETAAALSVVGFEFLKANDKAMADTAAKEALAPDASSKTKETQKTPPVRAEVVALALSLGMKPPTIGEKDEEKANQHVGTVEALAREGKWELARQKAASNDYGDSVQFAATLSLAVAAADAKIQETTDVDAAIKLADAKLRDKAELSWSLLRLIRLASRAGVPEDRQLGLANSIDDRALRGQAQLIVFRARLAASKQVVEDSAADKIEAASLARLQASLLLARHNTRFNAGWAATVQGWQQPVKAFGLLGVALGSRDRDKAK